MNIELNFIDDFSHPADISDDEQSLTPITEISIHNPKPTKPSSPHTPPYQTDTIQIPILSFSLNSESNTFKSILSY